MVRNSFFDAMVASGATVAAVEAFSASTRYAEKCVAFVMKATRGGEVQPTTAEWWGATVTDENGARAMLVAEIVAKTGCKRDTAVNTINGMIRFANAEREAGNKSIPAFIVPEQPKVDTPDAVRKREARAAKSPEEVKAQAALDAAKAARKAKDAELKAKLSAARDKVKKALTAITDLEHLAAIYEATRTPPAPRKRAPRKAK